MWSYFYNGDIPKYNHINKRLPYIYENYSNINPNIYKRNHFINTINKWKDLPYGFYREKYQDNIYQESDQTVKELLTNYDVYQDLMDGVFEILEKYNKTITNTDQFEEDVMYYLYHIMV